jgi:UDP:flavonoid glycosyltransferase YjiC (YdhE family)
MRILFTAQPGQGHLLPLVPAAGALLAAGHEVLVATSASAVPTVAAHGLPAVAAGIDWTMAEMAHAFPHVARVPGAAGKELLLRDVFCGQTARATATDLIRLAATWRPDLVVREIWEFGGGLAAAHLGVPSVVHGIGTWANAAEVLTAGHDELQLAWKELGHHGSVDEWVHGRRYLDPCPPLLQTEGVPAPAAPRLPVRPVELQSTAGDPDGSVLVTLGTVMHRNPGVLEMLLEGVGALGRPVVATTGPGREPEELGPQPPGVSVRQHVDLNAELSRSAVVVCHGGWGTVIAALAHGSPLVIVPLGADNAMNAAACERAGVGVSVPRGPLLGASIAGAVRRVLDEPGWRQAAQRAQQAIAVMPAPAAVLGDLLENLRR